MPPILRDLLFRPAHVPCATERPMVQQLPSTAWPPGDTRLRTGGHRANYAIVPKARSPTPSPRRTSRHRCRSRAGPSARAPIRPLRGHQSAARTHATQSPFRLGWRRYSSPSSEVRRGDASGRAATRCAGCPPVRRGSCSLRRPWHTEKDSRETGRSGLAYCPCGRESSKPQWLLPRRGRLDPSGRRRPSVRYGWTVAMSVWTGRSTTDLRTTS